MRKLFYLNYGHYTLFEINKEQLQKRRTWVKITGVILVLVIIYSFFIKPLLKDPIDIPSIVAGAILIAAVIPAWIKQIKQINKYLNN